MSTLIADRYEIDQSIGIGGMAEVFLATDRLLNRQVALKVLNRAYASQPAFVERFKREARAAAALDHPNIVPVYDWGESDESYFIVMGYVPGTNLSQRIKEQGTLPASEAVPIIAAVAGALEHAHEQGIVHRDVKPHNILIDSNGQPRVTDFGIAQAAGLSSLTETSVVLGSAHYLSPEQASRQTIDARSDIYSLGVVAFESLAGRPPFQGETIVDLAMQHINQQPPRLSSIAPDVSPAVEQVVMTCIQKDPDDRYSSAGEMKSALERALDAPHDTAGTAPTVAVGAAAAAAPASAHQERTVRSQAAPPRSGPPPAPPRRQRRWHGGWWAGLLVAGIAVAGLLTLILVQPDDEDTTNTTSPGGENNQMADPDPTEPPADDQQPAGQDDAEEPAGEEQSDEPPPEGEGEQDQSEPDTEDQSDEPADPAEDAPGQQDDAPPADAGEGEGAPEQSEYGEDQGEGQPQEPGENQDETSEDLQPQSLGTFTCDETVEGGTAEQINVPGNATCTLIGTQVANDIQMQPGASLQASDLEVIGNIQAEGANALELGGVSFIDGDIQFNSGGALSVSGATMTGNLQAEGNTGAITADGNTIEGNLEVEENSGGVTITGNFIDGDLECEDNNPPPTGGNNSVSGDREGQCADL